MPTVDLPDLRIAYDVVGSGPTVVLVMGLGVPREGWKLQVESLAARWRVVTFDNRGVGESTSTPGRYSTDQLADDAFRLLDRLGVDHFHLAGISMGGMIAQKMALRSRARVRSMALLATHGGGWAAAPAPGTVHGFLQLRRAMSPEDRFERMANMLFSKPFLKKNRDELAAHMLGTVAGTPQDPVGFRGQVAATMTHRTGVQLHALHGLPTLIATGTADAVVRPVNSRFLHQWMPWARSLTVPGAGHGLNIEAREEIDAELARLFAEAEARS